MLGLRDEWQNWRELNKIIGERLSGSSHPIIGIWNVEIMNKDYVGILEQPVAASMERRQNRRVNVTSVNALRMKRDDLRDLSDAKFD